MLMHSPMLWALAASLLPDIDWEVPEVKPSGNLDTLLPSEASQVLLAQQRMVSVRGWLVAHGALVAGQQQRDEGWETAEVDANLPGPCRVVAAGQAASGHKLQRVTAAEACHAATASAESRCACHA